MNRNIIYAVVAGMFAAIMVTAIAAKPLIAHLQLGSYGGTPAHLEANQDIIPWLGCCDVYTYTPSIQSVENQPPGNFRVQFRFTIQTSVTPDEFHMSIVLYKHRNGRPDRRIGSRIIRKDQLPAPGRKYRWISSPDFVCTPGRYYVKAIVTGIPRGGTFQGSTYYFPWYNFSKLNAAKGDQNKKPQVYKMWRTKCKGHDLLISYSTPSSS